MEELEYFSSYNEKLDTFVRVRKMKDIKEISIDAKKINCAGDYIKRVVKQLVDPSQLESIRKNYIGEEDLNELIFNNNISRFYPGLSLDSITLDSESINGNSRDKDAYSLKVKVNPIPTKSRKPAAIIKDFKKRFLEEIIGQPHSLDPIALTIEEMLNDLTDDGRPVGSFIFLGPTGVGKTETAKTVSGLIFDGNILRVDCSEYSLPHEYAKLIGSPPGWVWDIYLTSF